MISKRFYFRHLFVLITLIMWSASVSALAWQEGRGGGGMICRDTSGKITQAKLLDLWELETIPNRDTNKVGTVHRMNSSFRTQMDYFLTILGQRYIGKSGEYFRWIEYVKNRIHEVPADVELTPPTDTKAYFLASGCKIEGIVLYDDEADVLHLNKAIYDQLPVTDQVALWFHEGIYKAQRKEWFNFEALDSVSTRKIVGDIFSAVSEDQLSRERFERIEAEGLIGEQLKRWLEENPVSSQLSADQQFEKASQFCQEKLKSFPLVEGAVMGSLVLGAMGTITSMAVNVQHPDWQSNTVSVGIGSGLVGSVLGLYGTYRNRVEKCNDWVKRAKLGE